VSLEAKQALNNALIQSAQFQAARQTLGLSQEEMLEAVSRQQRRQARADQQFDPDQYLRQIAQSEKTTTTNVGRPELDGIKFLDDDELDAGFGRDQSQFYEYQDTDSQYDDQQRKRIKEDLLDAKEYKGSRSKKGLIADLSAELALNPEDFPVMAPKTVLTDALSDLQRSADRQQSGIGGSIARVFGGSGVDSETSTAMDALKVYLGNERAADARVGRATASRDRARFNPEMMEYNDNRADAEAQNIARTQFLGGSDGAMADEAIGRIGEIRRLGAAGSLGGMEQTQVIRQGPQGTFPNAEEIVDNTGRIVGYADPVTKAPIALDPALGISLSTQGANTPDTAQMMNSPQNPQTAREWTASNLPAMVQDTGSTPPRYPQANISKETTNFSNKLRELGIRIDSPSLQAVSGNIRSIDELEKAATFVNQELERKGDTLFVVDPETRKNIPAGTQVVSGLMQKLGMSSGDEQRLANSMFQLDAARRSSVNQNPTGTYLDRTGGPTAGITFDSPQEGFGNVGIAQQKGGTRVKSTGEDVVAAMAKLQSPGAAKPYIGMPAQRSTNPLSSFGQQEVYNRTGETDPAAIRSKLEQLSEGRAKKTESRADAAIRRKRNESNIIGAQAVQRRADEDLTRRADAMSSIISQLPPVGRRSRFPRG
jgi:hypothetical protein